ncbi:glutathione S-transferase 1-1-like [Amphibalanus amphitrite]|uniref:glutathione S-transferase 1-1-like n=1 Tax=Amphibalanus amphitrite TaxID=1232801 RepID=UPI001C903F38|nr:glutathione S-transferase 1-1-like [Amphibalanus amphitrite]
MGLDLYFMDKSSPARAALLLIKTLGLDVNVKSLDLFGGEHLQEDFVAINPQHTIPTLVDGKFVIWESRAIMTYLVSKYGKDTSLYPTDPEERAVVDQRLYFDMGTLYDSFGKCVYPIIFGGAKEVDEAALTKTKQALTLLEGFIGDRGFVAGSSLTVADIALGVTVSTLEASGILDLSAYPVVSAWLNKLKTTLPGYAEANQPGAEAFGVMFKKALARKS